MARLLAARMAILHETLQLDFEEAQLGPELVLFLLELKGKAVVESQLDLVVAPEEGDVCAGLLQFHG